MTITANLQMMQSQCWQSSTGEDVTKTTKDNSNGQQWLRIHKRHLGLYARVAEDLGVSPSYVSLVAGGARQSEKVKRALIAEIIKIHDSVR